MGPGEQRPVDDSSCDWNSEYTYDLTTTKAGPLWFVVADDDYSDNQGVLEVDVAPR